MKRFLQVFILILCTYAVVFSGCSGIETPSEKKGSISLSFAQTTNISIISGKSVNVDFTITGDVNGIVDVKCEAYNSWKAEVVKSSNTSGYIKVTSAGGDGKVTVVATCDGCTDTKELTFEGSVLSGVESTYEVPAEENTLTLNITTNIEYSIVIPSNVSWIKNTTTKATHTDVVTLLISKNEGAVRSAYLSINSKDGSELFKFSITQIPSAISFKDYYAEKVCLAKFDNNKDGKLSYDEIKDVTTIESKFFGNDAGNVKSFNELQYFTSVIKIDDMAFRNCEFLKSISFPANLKTIGNRAFSGAKSLETLTFPESLEEIGEAAFNQCEVIKEIVVPESVKIIKSSAFGTMYELEKLTINGSPDVEGGIVSDAPKLYKLIGPDASSDGRYFISKDGMAYVYASRDQFTASVPIGVKSIGSALFWGCHNLTEITLPSTVTSIGIRSFASTNNLKKVSLSDAIQIISESAFSGCHSLQEVKMPAELKKIEKLAFQYCKSMTGITIPYGCKGIGESAFEFCDKLKDIVLPGDIEEIGELCFRMCPSINSIVIPETIKTIGMGAFVGDTELSYVKMIGTIPPSIGQHAFSDISPSAKLSVPAGYSDAYQEWEQYFGGGIIMWGDVTLRLSIRGNETKASFDPYSTPSINDDDVVWVNDHQYNAKNSCVTVTPAKDYSVVFTGKRNAAMRIDGSDLCYVNFPSPVSGEAIAPYCGFSSGTEIELKPIAGMMKIQLQKAKDISHIIVRTNSSNNFLSGYVGYDLSGSKRADYSFAANYVRVQNEGTDNCMYFSVPAQTFPAGMEIDVYDKSDKLVVTKTSKQPITVNVSNIISVNITVGNDGM